MVATRQAGFEISEHGVDPLELGNVPRLAPGHHRRMMCASGVGNGSEAGQPVGEHRSSRRQRLLRPGDNRLEGAARHRAQSHSQRVILLGQGDGGDNGHLVLGTSSGLAAAALAAHVGVIDLNLASKDVALLPLGHGLHQFVPDQPGRGVAHAEMALQGQCRQPGLGLAD